MLLTRVLKANHEKSSSSSFYLFFVSSNIIIHLHSSMITHIPYQISDVFTPTYVELTSNNVIENVAKLQSYGVTYPFGELACLSIQLLLLVTTNAITFEFQYASLTLPKEPTTAIRFVLST